MTEQEAIWVLKDFDKQVTAKADGAYQSTIGEMACDVAISALEEIQQYRALGTVEKLREAKGKQVLKKPEYKILKSLPSCPNCGEVNLVQENEYGNVIYNNKFCPDCGQAIDWSN